MDLNLVRVFVAIAETQSLTTAASRLFVTQPAVSQALARLRRDLDDPLFERVGRSMVATPLAESMYPGFRQALEAIDSTLDGVHGFDPAHSERTVRIALSELGEIGWLPAIVRAVRASAPRMRIEVVPIEAAPLGEWLSRGTVDLAVTPAPVVGRFERVVLKSQRYGVAMAASHPLATGELTLDAYCAADHAIVASDSGAPMVEQRLRALGVDVRSAVAVNHVAALPPVLAGRDGLIATMPDTIAEGWTKSWPLIVRPLPFEMPAIDVCLYRRSTTHDAAGLDWLFTTVAHAIRGSSGRFAVIHGDTQPA